KYNFDFSEKFEILLLDLHQGFKERTMEKIALQALKLSLFDVNHSVILISILMEKHCLSIDECSSFLNTLNCLPESQKNKLLPSVSKALDVSWLTEEDRKDKHMTPNEDNLLYESLHEVKRVVKGLYHNDSVSLL
ncbi:MAG: hypothetical protein AAGB12_16220, partial [Pseudomonadota bacterium]